jgi:hypothetical protein
MEIERMLREGAESERVRIAGPQRGSRNRMQVVFDESRSRLAAAAVQ